MTRVVVVGGGEGVRQLKSMHMVQSLVHDAVDVHDNREHDRSAESCDQW